jgi:HEAT repeat protein
MMRWLWASLGVLVVLAGCSEDPVIPEEEERAMRAVFQEGLASSDPWVRAETVRAIEIAGSSDLAPLVAPSMADASPLVRGTALIALSRSDVGGALGPAVEALGGDDQRLRRTLFAELLAAAPEGKLRDDLIQHGLTNADREVRLRAVRFGVLPRVRMTTDEAVLRRTYYPELSTLVDDEDPEIAGLALHFLEERNKLDRAKPLLETATSGTVKGRRWALKVFAAAGLKRHLPAMRRIHEGAEPGTIRDEALLARLSLGDASAVDGARQLLSGATEERARRTVVALGNVKEASAVRILKALRSDGRASVRSASFAALAATERSDAKDFSRGLADEDPDVRSVALRSVIRTHPTFLRAVLEKGLASSGHPDRIVGSLLTVFHQIEVDGDADELDRLEAQLSSLEDKLLPLMVHPTPTVRAGAAEILFRAEDPTGAFRSIGEPADEVHYALLEALAKRPGKGATLEQELGGLTPYRTHSLLAFRVLAAAGVWGAYHRAAGRNSP